MRVGANAVRISIPLRMPHEPRTFARACPENGERPAVRLGRHRKFTARVAI
jgi:hypothetical protein